MQSCLALFFDADIDDGAAGVAENEVAVRAHDPGQCREAAFGRHEKGELVACQRYRVAFLKRQRLPDLILRDSMQSVEVDDPDLEFLCA